MAMELHREYAELVQSYLSTVPSTYGLQSQEIDAYFRASSLCLWAVGGGGTQSDINQIYTANPVRFTAAQFGKAIAHYRDNPHYSVGIPDFFVRLISEDVANGTTYSRRFLAVQREILTLCASCDGDFTMEESRRITELNRILEKGCNDAGVLRSAKPNLTVDPALNRAKELTEIMDQFDKVLAQDKTRGMYSDFFGGMQPSASKVKSGNTKDSPQESPKTVSPEIAGSAKVEEEAPEKPSLEEALEELHSLVGLENVKQDVDSLVNLAKVRAIRQEHGLKSPKMSFHLVFSGNPGTGKTTVARIIGKIYSALGLLSKGQLVEVDRSGLVAGYVGQTATKTQEVIQKAMGGILFIDEAYALAPENSDKDFGQEAIDTILKAMEDHRDDLVVIVAGYRSLMPRFINSNPGLKSRFNKYLYFEDYTGEQLMDMFRIRLKSNDYRLASGIDRIIQSHLQGLYENRDDNFGNGRDVRNLFEKIIVRQADRIAAAPSLTEEDIMTITREDLKGLMDVPEEVPAEESAAAAEIAAPKPENEKQEDATV